MLSQKWFPIQIVFHSQIKIEVEEEGRLGYNFPVF